MHHALANAGFVLTAVLTVLACGEKGADRQRVGDTVAKSPATGVIDTGKSVTSTGELPVTLPVSEKTPVGVRIDSVTVWVDSTRIGAAAKALGRKSALGRYEPYERLLVACYRLADPRVTYVMLKAGHADTARVVEIVISRDRNMARRFRCASFPHGSPRLSNSLGLRLGMTRTEVERVLGTSGDTTRALETFGAEYTMGRFANDTSAAAADRALHSNVITDVTFQRDTLTLIAIHRGNRLPRFVE